jgi:hypothetical protein
MSVPHRLSRETALLLCLLAAGIVLRLIWLAQTPSGLTGFAGGGEAARVALTLAREGRFADAFWDGSGPTAHLMPVSPAAAALVFRLFPPAGAAASLTMTAWALLQSLAGYLLLRALFQRLGAHSRGVRWALAFLLLVPIFAPEETIGFRYWDGALAVCLSAANLLAALAVERSGAMSVRSAVGAAILWAITAFAAPIAGFALALAWAWVVLRRLPFGQAARFATLSAIALAAMLTPWTIRNGREVGSPVVLRSNFGLEFAIGTHPAALSDQPPAKVYLDRLKAVHPLYGGPGKAALIRAGGEVPYFRRLGAETWRWAATHPLAFARLSLGHLVQFFAPPAWTLLLSTWDDFIPLRAALITLVDLAGLFAIGVGIRQKRPGYALLAIFVTVAALPYALVQPNPRYTYLVWGLLAFAAADGLSRYLRSRRGAGYAR